MIYFDHSSTTPTHSEVSKRMYEINQDHFANPSSVYESGRKAKSLIEHARFQIAEAIGAKSSQIYFCSGGTEANNQVLWSLVNQKNKHIIISAIEHPAISKVLDRLKAFGVESTLVPVDKQGVLNSSILLDFNKKFTSHITCSFQEKMNQNTRINFTNGHILIEDSWAPGKNMHIIISEKDKKKKIEFVNDNIYSYQIKSISNQLIENKIDPIFPSMNLNEIEMNTFLLSKWINN